MIFLQYPLEAHLFVFLLTIQGYQEGAFPLDYSPTLLLEEMKVKIFELFFLSVQVLDKKH